ncbi:DUF2163 domain-containing protein [Sinirhodobacter sp. WL0062]|uniref:DUF2163 domain-containing protein n=1 Tax=Rhodobacter flavimaris TaxID=2907145 RepID=A0ABS8YTN1_9RHOB|nr:DUF2163 domain-containing protein [Sinirhodobacter sp. WL0062]MCE5972096.1 DUF2163 domain-containing protein [Sinirhodobacter sp. WL0062]
MSDISKFNDHLATGCTTIARAWAVERTDGLVLGFTDHDRALNIDGVAFQPESGMTAKAVVQSTGLSVDNSESYGVLSSDSISEEDILAGRYDRAEVRVWIVNWAEPAQRQMIFRGHIGELSRSSGGFRAELRGLSEALGQEYGRIYHPRCSAVLGDRFCRFDLGREGYAVELAVEAVEGDAKFQFAQLTGYQPRWFEKGRLRVLSGKAEGLFGVIKNDRILANGARSVELWQQIGAVVQPGDTVRLEAGCDRRAETCRMKFNNFLNFRGFPHIPGEDWLMSYPVRSGANDGGSLFK